MAATAGAFTNMTSFLPSPADLLMVFPRLFDKVSSYGDAILSGGSVIAEPTMANLTNVLRFFVDIVWTEERPLGMAATRFIELLNEQKM